VLPPAKGSPSLNIQPPHRHGHAPARRKPGMSGAPAFFGQPAAFLAQALQLVVLAPQRLGLLPVTSCSSDDSRGSRWPEEPIQDARLGISGVAAEA
jgi:hypothetical protein